jgi:hypothetical protein
LAFPPPTLKEFRHMLTALVVAAAIAATIINPCGC